ncbi:LCP family protein [Actinoplanes sp. NPDC026623]|uniref:LCP family protein n=1 Tax=Actinoplanes sp. NPDC026623 TaxID=3155610 RepID=UPI0033CF9DE9
MSGEPAKRKRSRAPRWASVCIAVGAVLSVTSGVTLAGMQILVSRYANAVATEDLLGDSAAGAAKAKVSDIKGPLNILLVGIDPRKAETRPLADSIMVAHVPPGLKQVFLFSMPRDLLVDIPAFDKNGFRGGRDKLNAAMSYGSVVPTGNPNTARGFELLSRTVSKRTGIKSFSAGAIINFAGFKEIVDAMGGVTMTIDERTRSEHLKPDGTGRTLGPSKLHYIGPQKVYEKGTQHLKGWEALDFVRQRYGLKGSDYARQRHQQQFVKAMAEQALSKNVATNPVKLDKVLRAAGKALIFDGKGHTVVDWGLALKGISPDNITMIKLPGGAEIIGGDYRGEVLRDTADEFFAALRAEKLPEFVIEHPEFINTAQ